MKILQVCNHYFPFVGGAEEYVRNISERLASRHEVTVFTTNTMDLPNEEELNGVRIRRFRSFSPNNAYHISPPMLRVLKKCQFDIVHGHNYHALPLYFSRYANKERFIVTPHYHRRGVTPFRNMLIRLYKPLGNKIFREADKIVLLSNYEKELLMQDFHIPEGKIVLLPGGVNFKDFEGLSKQNKEHKTILCVARLEEFKGIQYAIQALPQLEQSIRLEIVGTGIYKQSLLKLARNLGVAHRTDFRGELRGKDLLNRYARADLFMLLSNYESFGMVVVEALASKTPCIVANTSGLREWVDNKNCFGVDYPINIDKLASLITRIIGKKVEETNLWDWDEVARKMELVYTA